MADQQTSVVYCKKYRYDVYIGRPSKWGNPFTHIADRRTKAAYIVGSREEAIRRYEEYLYSSGLIADIEELRGKVLGCWCSPKACHGDVLARLLNETAPKTALLSRRTAPEQRFPLPIKPASQTTNQGIFEPE